MSADFDAFWNVYPKRLGQNPKYPARTIFERAIARGAKAEDIIAGAKALAADPSIKKGTEFVPMARTWLFQRRWEDYQGKNSSGSLSDSAPSKKPTHGLPYGNGIWVQQDTGEWEAWSLVGNRTPVDKHGGWVFPTRWPPDFEEELGTNSGNFEIFPEIRTAV